MKTRIIISVIYFVIIVLISIFVTSGIAIISVMNTDITDDYDEKMKLTEYMQSIKSDVLSGENTVIIDVSKYNDVEFNTYKKGDNIVLYYKIVDSKNTSSSNDTAYAKITLSNMYEIVDEEYKPEIKISHEEYISKKTEIRNTYNTMGWILIVALFFSGVAMFTLIFYSTIKNYKSDNSKLKKC